MTINMGFAQTKDADTSVVYDVSAYKDLSREPQKEEWKMISGYKCDVKNEVYGWEWASEPQLPLLEAGDSFSVELRINDLGKVDDIQIVESSTKAFNDEILAELRKSKFYRMANMGGPDRITVVTVKFESVN